MAWSFNPFTGNLDITGGGGAVVFEGEVETFADLSETIGDPPVGSSFLVRSSTGVWLVNRRQAGIWIRRNNTGVRATDWEYGGDYPVNSVNGQTGNVSLGSSDVGAEPIDYTIVNSAATLTNGAKVAADTTAGAFTLTLPATPANGDTVSIFDRAGTFDTNNLILGRNGSNIEGLAEDLDCNIEDAAFSLVYVDATTGWKVMPYFGNKTNFASPDPIGSVVPNTGAFTSLSANNGTLTASAPVLDLSQTWNDSGTAFTAIKLDITNTASDLAGSKILDVSVGGTNNVLNIYRSTNSAFQAPTFEFGNTGVTSRMRVRTSAGVGVNFDQNVGVGGSLQFGVGAGTGGGDVILSRDAADTLALVRGTNAQTFNIYNTSSSGNANHERGFMRWSSNVLQIGTEKAGTGSARALEFQTDGVTRASVTTGGNFWVNNQLILGTSAHCRITSPADGIVTLFNSGQTTFNRLQFGGTTSSFPALKRNSTTLEARLADDSAYTAIQGKLTTETAYTAGAPTATGYLVLYDSNGTAYKVPAEAL